MNTPRTRAEAKQQNSKHYFTGSPCSRGHIALRFTSIGKCKQCAAEDSNKTHVHTTSKRRAYSDLQGLIDKIKSVHPDKYTFDSAEYVNAHTKITITCKIHGDFLITPTNIVQGKGCQSCAIQRQKAAQIKSVETFIREADAIWQGAFDYADVEYLGAKVKVSIKCVKHGEIFYQQPDNHLEGKNPCSKCNRTRKPKMGVGQNNLQTT